MKKFIATVINMISAIIVIATLCILQSKFPQDDILAILSSPVFEKTADFTTLINDRVEEVFSLINLKNSFESNGELNYNAIIAESLDGSVGVKKWTVNDCLDEATKHGLYIDTDYNVKVQTDSKVVPFDKTKVYNFMFKTYPSTSKTGASTEEEFLTEFMSVISKYYKSTRDLNDDISNFKYNLTFDDVAQNKKLEYKNTDLTNKEIIDTNAFIYLSSKENAITSNIDFINSSTLKNAKINNPHPGKEFTLYCFVDTTYSGNDEFAKEYNLYSYTKDLCGRYIAIIAMALIAFIVSLIVAMALILSSEKSLEESKKLFYSIPTEFYVVMYILLTALCIYVSNKFMVQLKIPTNSISQTRINLYVLSFYVTTILLFAVLSSKYSNDTLMPISLKAIKESEQHGGDSPLRANILFSTIFIPIILFTLISIYLIYLYSVTNFTQILIIGIVLLFLTVCFVVYLLMLHDAFNKAIDVQVKSNDMRTSLIANVSHDIKTPLTSILNYTNLITNEINKPSRSSKKNINQYSEIIINKSNRLNDLINDLIFDSKVSSGNVELDMQKLDLNAFLTQVITEFSDKLKENNLKIVYNSSTKNAFINADSSQLYRVFQNLFSNIHKYALEKSRVYIDLDSSKSKISVTLKNIQKEKIEVSVDTLKDRFVRGSKSRTTEGFGLGLSISENLIKSMGGKLEISNVRDQFITKITFVAYEL